jgi:hypothetical protein
MPTLTNITAPCGEVQSGKPCRICGVDIAPLRAALEKTTCIDCQIDLDRTQPVKHLIAIPYGKGAYQYIHNPQDLFLTNQKDPRL